MLYSFNEVINLLQRALHQVQSVAFGIAAHVKLDTSDGESGAVAVLAACPHHVEVEACQALCVSDGTGAQAGWKKGKLMALIVGVAPGQGLRARGFENILGAAIAEGVHGDAVAMPDQGPARRFRVHQKIAEHHVQAEGKTGNGLAGPGAVSYT